LTVFEESKFAQFAAPQLIYRANPKRAGWSYKNNHLLLGEALPAAPN
jgi:hypothetical protein